MIAPWCHPDLGWAAIAGCQEVWRAACRLRADEDEERPAERLAMERRARDARWRAATAAGRASKREIARGEGEGECEGDEGRGGAVEGGAVVTRCVRCRLEGQYRFRV